MASSGKVTLPDGAILPYQVLLGSPQAASATPLLMIQGLSGSKENWFDLPQLLARDRPVAIFDNRGISQRPVPEGPYSVALMASDAVAVADHLGWRQFHVLGISMGGAITQMVALNFPTRVKKLVIGCSSSLFLEDADPEALLAIVPNGGGKPTPEQMMQTLRKGLEINLTEEQVNTQPKILDQLVQLELKLKKPARAISECPSPSSSLGAKTPWTSPLRALSRELRFARWLIILAFTVVFSAPAYGNWGI